MRERDFRSFGETLMLNAEVVPRHVAFAYLDDEGGEHRVRFEELHERALGVAHGLLASANPGDRALLLLPPGLDYVATIFGCFYAGVIGVCAPPPQPNRLERTLSRLLGIAESAGTRTVVTTTQFLEAARSAIPDGHPLVEARWLAADASPPATDPAAIAVTEPGDVAFLQYTSGSTAAPRGVRLTHANLLSNSRFIAREFGHDPEHGLGFNWIPPFHDMGLIGTILQPVYAATAHLDDVVRLRDPDRPISVLASPLSVVKRPIRWLEGITRYRASTSGGPNFAYDMCVQRIPEESCRDLDLSSWEVAFNGAEPIRYETMTAFASKFGRCGFRSRAFCPVYGLAEATLMVTAPMRSAEPTATRFEATALNRNTAVTSGRSGDPLLVGCGSPDEGHRVEIVNPETGSRAAPETVGEIWVSGPSVADGYWDDDEGPDRVFGARLADCVDGNRFLRTGDLGVFHEGQLYVIGRSSDLIILNGRNYHPHDIECLAEDTEPLLLPHATAAFELPSKRGEPQIALVAETRSADREELQSALARVRSAVATEMQIPLSLTTICTSGSIPKTTSGKIQRRLCRSMLLAGELEVLAQWPAPARADEMDPA